MKELEEQQQKRLYFEIAEYYQGPVGFLSLRILHRLAHRIIPAI